MSELRLKVATVWRGEWSAEVAYNVLDEVSFSAEAEGIKRGNYRSLLAANREPLCNENAWVLVLDLEKTQSVTKEAEEMNEAFAEAESKRVEAENKRVTAESGRVEAENKRVIAENSRVEAENKRVTAESGRADAESNRRTAETVRISNEQARVSAENNRADAETNRRIAEETRISNEQTRVTAESGRVAAETNRANAFITAQNEREEAFNAAEAGRDALVAEKVEDITRLQGEVTKKANVDGHYSSMAVGAAESLIGQNVTTQQFTFQPSGNTLDVQDGIAVVKSIKGNTVVANQLVNDYVYSYTANGINFGRTNQIISITGTLSSPSGITLPIELIGEECILGHKYLFGVTEMIPDGFYLGFNDETSGIIRLSKTKKAGIVEAKATYSGGNLLYIVGDSSEQTTGTIYDYNSVIFFTDLTQMFGAGNEPTTVEEFERLYPNLPKEYNAGSLLNLNADSIKSVGFNAYNGEYAKVLGGMQYYLGGNITSLTFKENLGDGGQVIEIPSDKLYTPTTNGYLVATGSNICINLSHSGYRNGEYEDYKESIVNLPIKKYFPDGMKSAGEVSDEIIWDEGLKKYKAIQRVGNVDLGTLSWREFTVPSDDKLYRYSGNTNNIPIKANFNRICVNFSQGASVYDVGENIMTYVEFAQGHLVNIFVDKNKYPDVASFKQSLQGQILYYELATPIETIIDDYDGINYEVSDFGTEEIIADEPTTPIIIEVVYGINAVDTLRRLPQTYISADSMREFLAQLGSAMNGNWAMEYDDANSKWIFVFTANEVVNNEEQIEL